ncbi:MAG: phytanoyl-CoA dioxygenase family protein [Oligoflexales bacterium]
MLTGKQIDSFSRCGYLILENWATDKECEQLKNQMNTILDNFSQKKQDNCSFFSTTTKDHESDRYFLDSANKISIFYEKESFSSEGKLQYPLSQSINKVGHALHELDAVFMDFSSQKKIVGLCELLSGITRPHCIQSMYIFKQPKIGGEVVCHQDSTYIHTKSGKLLGMWLALEDANQENGCLWGIPGR